MMWRRVVLAGATAGVALLSASAVAAGPAITSVTFTGSQAHPLITITGSGFGTRPSPNPGYHPPSLSHPLCPARPTKPLAQYGFDYGTRLYLQDSTAHPIWSAGRYRPGIGELDCIGLLIKRYSPTKVIYALGAAYPHIPNTPSTWALAPGDTYTVGVNGASSTGKVHYS